MGKKKVQFKTEKVIEPESDSDSGIEFTAEPEPNPNFDPNGNTCKKCKIKTKTIEAKITTCKGKTENSKDRLRITGKCAICGTNKNEYISQANADKINLSQVQ